MAWRKRRVGRPRGSGEFGAWLAIRVSAKLLARCQRAAERSHNTFASWVRAALEQALANEAKPPRRRRQAKYAQ